jgi:predicted ribosomally synthesized peptide with nif11-like leader
MSIQQAQAMVKRLAEDETFRQRLEAAPTPQEKRAILTAEGYGDIKLRHVSQALPTSMGGELSDEELGAVAGGSTVSWVTLSLQVGAAVAAA